MFCMHVASLSGATLLFILSWIQGRDECEVKFSCHLSMQKLFFVSLSFSNTLKYQGLDLIMVLCWLLAAKFLFQSDLHISKQQSGHSEELSASFLCSAQNQSDAVLFQSSYLLYGNRCQIATINGAQADLKCVAHIYKHGTSAVTHKWGSVGIVFYVLCLHIKQFSCMTQISGFCNIAALVWKQRVLLLSHHVYPQSPAISNRKIFYLR